MGERVTNELVFNGKTAIQSLPIALYQDNIGLRYRLDAKLWYAWPKNAEAAQETLHYKNVWNAFGTYEKQCNSEGYSNLLQMYAHYFR